MPDRPVSPDRIDLSSLPLSDFLVSSSSGPGISAGIAAPYVERASADSIEQALRFSRSFWQAIDVGDVSDDLKIDCGAETEQLLRAILLDALALSASHLHVEPAGGGVVFRLRYKGVLYDRLRLTRKTGQLLLKQLDVIADAGGIIRLDPDRDLSANSVVFTVSRLEMASGTRFLISRPNRTATKSTMNELGLGPVARRVVQSAMGHRSGLILIAGLPGSGRRNTMRAMLKSLSEDERSIIAMSSLTRGLTLPMADFAFDMDSGTGNPGQTIHDLVQQDPDVLALDLDADPRMAEPAIEAALNGQLVIARIDAPDAIAAISRLKTMRVDSFMIASALRAILAQRLSQRLCVDCSRSEQASGSTAALLGFDTGAIVYRATGCSQCEGKGWTGHVAVFEVIDADQTIKRLINSGGDAAILARHAFLNAPNLGSASRAMVREGVISPEEAMRISRGEPLLV